MSDLTARLTTALAGRYAIDGLAGEGGMATVFRATDLKHHRAVAIKVLRPELAATVGSERFLQEIELSARLQHPHILPLYDSGDAGGLLYYVMPFVEGESLRDRLTRDGKVPFDEAVALLREIASALGYAHAQGIVHRDIKPENILLSGGHAVVADFGIARALRVAAGGQQMTGLGFAIGTPAYMSPEQATASEVDGRSDQYSLACVFYEMVTGQAPFAAATVQAVLTQSLTGPRPRLSKVTRTTPPEADAPVQRALASDPAQRFPTVQEFAAALERAAGGGAGAAAERRRLRRLAFGLPVAITLLAAGWILFGPSRGHGPVVEGAETIAVLPFSATGPGVELMGEGMVDLLSTNLNTVGGIKAVDPRIVLSRWKKSGATGGADVETALGIARAVKAQAALTGSIVATGSRVRLSADLYGPEGTSLARAQVDGAADSVLGLVDELSRSLVREIWRSKEPVPSLRVSGLTTNSLDAMREYLSGEQFYRRSEWDSAGAAFQRAIDQDSTFALAHYRLAMALGWKGGYGLPRARQASEAALRFSTRLPPRERKLVAVYQLFSTGKLAAVDSARAYVAAYPDDIEGWYLLGETQYHTRERTGVDPVTIETSFEKVVAADSSLTPALIHPLELSLASVDSVRYGRYLALLRSGGSADEYEAFRAAGAIVWQNREPDTLAARLLGGHGGAVIAGFAAIHENPAAGSDDILQRFAVLDRVLARTRPEAARAQMAAARAMVLTGLGRFKEVSRLADSLKAVAPDQAGGIKLFPFLVGIAPPGYEAEFMARFRKAPITNPFAGYLTAIIALNEGEVARGGKIVDSLLAGDTTQIIPGLRVLLRATRGLHTALAGDTARGLAQMGTALQEADNLGSFLSGPLRLQYAALLASHPNTRPLGEALLRNGFANDIGFLPLANYALARAYEAAGDKPRAAEAYGMFLHQWDKADESAKPRVDQAKEALAKLTGEGGK
ncbi:MAG TPA: protein kinase [Gemmatimonadales bacterium]|nr:protein kinase [Gemmatimonadales bacterium]